MTPPPDRTRPVLYVIACAAPPTSRVGTLVTLAYDGGWDVCVILTPQAVRFADVPALETLTGHPVRSQYKAPGTVDVLPPADAMIVAPATCNTINKWACGISDTLALGLVTEAIGKKLPLVALPFTNAAQAAHPAFVRHVGELRGWGVRVLFGPDVYPLHEPGTGSRYLDIFPWHLTLRALPEHPPRPPRAPH